MRYSGFRVAATALAFAFCQGSATTVFAEDTAESKLVAQSEATEIAAAIAAYRAAQSDLETTTAADGDVETAQAQLDAATAELSRLCGLLGQDDIDACVAAVESGASAEPVAAPEETLSETQPVEGDQPEPTDQAAPADQMDQAAPAEQVAPVEEPSEPQPTAEPQATEPQAEEVAPSDVNQSEPDEPAAEQTEAPQPEAAPQPAEPTASEPADATDAGGASAPAATVDDTRDSALEAPATEEAASDEPVVNPKGTPLPRELSDAIATYEDANRQLAKSTAGTPEADEARQALEAARNDISALCDKDGASDIDTCLAAYGVALTPEAEPMSADAKPAEEPAGPEAEQAPLLDSAKDAQKLDASAEPAQSEAVESAPAEAPPESDADAQADMTPEEIPSIKAEPGTEARSMLSIDASGPEVREQPANAEVVQQSGPRIVFKFNNQLFISNQSDNRLSYGADERYVEQLPRGRTRETLVRANGIRLVTIYDRYGDILRRSHFDQNGNETILAYVPETYDDTISDWVDPAQNLPPLDLNIPPEDYVLDAEQADLNSLTNFLDSPPVEKVRRLYSIDEVKRSARLRDMVRRLEIGNLTFAFGSAGIPPDQLGALSIVANAMLRLIDENPAETFLIEGHTDAVGSDYANLILSDQRAYSVAIALTEVFGVPPENIATQGYGERYLKVLTEAPERANRRVTIRRITPLVAPASSGYVAG